MGKFCSSPRCFNNTASNPSGVSFFKYPKDETRCKIWLTQAGCAELLEKSAEQIYKSGYLLCGKHFRDDQFYNTKTRNRLLKDACPTIFPRSPCYGEALCTSGTSVSSYISRQQTSNSHLTTDSIESAKARFAVKRSCELPTTPVVSKKQNCGVTETRETLEEYIHWQQSKLNHLSAKLLETETELNSLKHDNNLKNLEFSVEDISRELTKTTRSFFVNKLNLASTKKRWKLWSESEKRLSLCLYFKNPHAYKVLKSAFKLPGKATLKNWLIKMKMTTGICSSVVKALSKKAEGMSPSDRICVLSIHDISLKAEVTYDEKKDCFHGLETITNVHGKNKLATRAVVIMARGLLMKWKQPLFYYFVNDSINEHDLKHIFEVAVCTLQGIGLTVKVLVCNQNLIYHSLFNQLGATTKKPWIFIEDCKIFCMYEPSYLLNCLRDNVKKYDLKWDNNIFKWIYLHQFFRLDNLHPLRMAPSIKLKHLLLPKFSKVNVNLAAKVFNRTVATSMGALRSYNILPEESKPVSEFLLLMDRWFSTFNSVQIKHKEPYKCAISHHSKHIKFLKNFLLDLSTWSFDTKHYIPTLSGLEITTTALIMLWEDLQATLKPEHLCTKQLNQDSLQSLFSSIEYAERFPKRPTPLQFEAAFRKILVENLLKPMSSNKNCREENNHLMLQLADFYSAIECSNSEVPFGTGSTFFSDADDLSELLCNDPGKNYFNDEVISFEDDCYKQNSAIHIAGYIASKILKASHCDGCQSQLTVQSPTLTKCGPLYIYFIVHPKHQGSDLQRATLVSKDLQDFITIAKSTFKKHIKHCADVQGIKKHLSELVLENSKHIWCDSTCKICKKNLKELAASLYLNTVLHDYVKRSTIDFSKCQIRSAKRNRMFLPINLIS